MNTRPVLDSDKGPFALSASFNADKSCFSVALESGFRGMHIRAAFTYSSTNICSLILKDWRPEARTRYVSHFISMPPSTNTTQRSVAA